MKISKDKTDIDLMQSELAVELFNDTEDAFGIASQFVTPKRAAGILEISLPTLRRYTKLGFIKRYQVGGRKYYQIAELHQAKANIF